MIDRFSQSLRILGVPDDAPLGLAVSGGPDSLALLLLAAEARPGRVLAATVDHGLRPAARAEAEQVAAICRARDIPHAVLTVRVEGSVQASARAARYDALGHWCDEWGLRWLATAHHADDQAETMLMRLARGAGLSGLAGVRRRRPLRQSLTLIRPLLEWRKQELVAIVAAAGLEPASDPSNSDPAFDRTHARKLMEDADWLEPVRLATSAANLADAEEAIDWTVEQLAAERIRGDTLDPSALPSELVRRLLLRLLSRSGVHPRGPELTRMIAALESGRGATLGAVKVSPGSSWTVSPAPPRRSDQ